MAQNLKIPSVKSLGGIKNWQPLDADVHFSDELHQIEPVNLQKATALLGVF